MSESDSTPPEGAEQQPPTADEQSAETFDADYVAKLRKEAAKYRTEAKANAEAARKLAEYESKNRSVEEQLAELKAQNAKIQRDSLASRIAAQHGILPEDADLFLTGADEDTLVAQATRLAGRIADKRRAADAVPSDRGNPTPSADPMRDFVRQVFEGA